MFAKKISRMWCIVIAFCLWGVSIASTIVVHQDQENTRVLDNVSAQDEGIIIATGQSSFGNNAVTGRACVVTSRKQLNKVRKGDIVVTSAINDLWYPQLSIAGGIITEKGDRSGHTVGLGKSLEIPVIVGVTGVTKKIVDGQIITCDPITRNIYHVAYPISHDVRFDALAMPAKDIDYLKLHDKPEKTNNGRPSYMSEKPAAVGAMDYFVQPMENSKNASAAQNMQQCKIKRITKDVYLSHFNDFKKFVLKEKSWFEWTKKWFGIEGVEAGARRVEGYDEFAVDCICVGESFIGNSEEYISDKLQKIGKSEESIQYLDSLIDDCSKKPKDLNYAARIAHQKCIRHIEMPAGINKEHLMEHPREYKKIENKVNQEEREAFVIAGYFVRYWIKKKLPL